jgi:ABC-type polysaccharide/polyol phosphate export permease
MLGEQFTEILRYRGLLGMLVWRDIRVRYKQSLLGVTWAFLMPLINALVLYAIFTFSNMIDVTDTARLRGMPYMLFVLTGVVLWGFFAGTLTNSMDCLTRNSRLVTKIYFPREVFPLAAVAGALVDFAIAALVVVPFYLYYTTTGAVHPSARLLLIPFVLLIEIIFAAGLALFLSMANLFFRDVKYIMTFVVQMWFFATNVVYPITLEARPHLKWIASANPMIPIFDAYRALLMNQPIPNKTGLALAALIACTMFYFGWKVFHRAEFKFAEVV